MHVVILPLVFAKLLNVLMGSVLYLQIKLVKIVYVAYVLTATIYLKIVVVTANTLGTTAVTLLSKPRLQLPYYYQYRVPCQYDILTVAFGNSYTPITFYRNEDGYFNITKLSTIKELLGSNQG